MIAELKAYPKMKDSGVPWLGKIPYHWNMRRAKWLFRKMNRIVRDFDEVVTCFRDGSVTLRKNRRLRGFTESLKEIGYQGIRQGDLVIHAMDAFAGAIGVADSDGKGTPVYSVCKPMQAANSHYFAFTVREMARSAWIQALAKGIRERSTDFRFEEFSSQLLPLPPSGEQAAIVRFLDYMDRRIRRYIRAKQKLIKLLEEQKQAIIHRAVTRGLDPNVRLKPSGVAWLGEVPEHWEIRRLKNLCSMRSGEGITAISIEPKGDYPVFGGNGIRGYTSQYTHDGNFILLGRQGALCGNVHVAHGRFWASEHAVVTTLHGTNDLNWLAAVLRIMNLNQYSIAAAQPGLAVERIQNLTIPIPPRQEQEFIAEKIQGSTTSLAIAIEKMHREISIIREYRTRLIADVVTGKLDVREAAARLPDEMEEPEPIEEESENGAEEAESGEMDEAPEEAES
ncbi:MAG: restriction endonuclease subunit S [Anaerolineales bacterium]|nr:restriction endonuclease subunit S [Anaerolineales bacterium]